MKNPYISEVRRFGPDGKTIEYFRQTDGCVYRNADNSVRVKLLTKAVDADYAFVLVTKSPTGYKLTDEDSDGGGLEYTGEVGMFISGFPLKGFVQDKKSKK